MKVLQQYRLFFVRYTPDIPMEGIGKVPDYQNKIFAKVNEPYSYNKRFHPHQAFGVMEYSKKDVLHFHFLLCIKGSITTVRSALKTRLNATGNKMMSIKEYPYSESSFDKSLVYMYKGNPNTKLLVYEYGLVRCDTDYKDKGALYYASAWVCPPSTKTASQKQRDEKYKHYRELVIDMLNKERRDMFMDKYLYKLGLEKLKVKIFKRLVYEKLRAQNFGNFRAISEMTQWLALDLWEEVENIDDLIDPIYEKYAENYKIKII